MKLFLIIIILCVYSLHLWHILRKKQWVIFFSLLGLFSYIIAPILFSFPKNAYITNKNLLLIALQLVLMFYCMVFFFRMKFTAYRQMSGLHPNTFNYKKLSYAYLCVSIIYIISCYLYWKNVLNLEVFTWIFSKVYGSWRPINDFWNPVFPLFHLTFYRAFMFGFAHIAFLSSIVNFGLKKSIKNLHLLIICGATLLFQFFMVSHKSWVFDLLQISLFSLFTFLFTCYFYRGLPLKYLTIICILIGISLFPLFKLANHSRTLETGGTSLISRFSINADCDLFFLEKVDKLFKLDNLQFIAHPFLKFFDKNPIGSHSLGRQAYIEIKGKEKAKKDNFPTWWPTPISFYAYFMGYFGILLGVCLSSLLLCLLEWYFRTKPLPFYLGVSFAAYSFFAGVTWMWFFYCGVVFMLIGSLFFNYEK